MRRMMLLFGICVICLFSSQVVYADRVHVHRGGHYLEWNDKPLIPVGDSVTQGWFLSGADFNHEGYINALADKNMNIVMLWAFAGLQGTKDERRLYAGYENYVIWPWIEKGNEKYNLDLIDQRYFDRLKAFVDYANQKNMVVLITVFDGWIRGAFNDHPFNAKLGGPLTAKGNGQDFVKLAYPGKPLFPNLNVNKATSAEKNQYYQEKFADKLISTLMPYGNVIYEISNEKDFYKDGKNRKDHEEHFLRFFRKRLQGEYHTLLLTNEDQVNNEHFDAHTNIYADVVTKHGGWTKDTSVWKFPNFTDSFNMREPAKPYIFSEPVVGWSGEDNRTGNTMATPNLDDIRRSVWETTLSGAGWVNQNDPSWGWNTKATISNRGVNRDIAYKYAGYCADFLNNKINIEDFRPTEELNSSIDTTVLRNNKQTEYVIYSPTGGDFTIYNLPQKDYLVYWLNPKDGTYRHGGLIGGGETIISSPFDEDVVLHLTRKPLAVIPSIIGSLLK